MKRLSFIIMFFGMCFFFNLADTSALSASEYRSRNMCGEGKYELAGAHTNGNAAFINCYNTFNEAHNAMTSNGAEDLIVFERKNGVTTIVDAQYALLDLTVNPKPLTYYFPDEKDTTRENNYMDNGSAYGGVDGAFIKVNLPNKVSRLKVAGYDGWINPGDYEIVPLNWVKSSSSYTVTDSTIRHNYVAKIQNTYNGNSGRNIGPKPSMVPIGNYYSYDGKYFYKTRIDMLKDYKAGTTTRAVNSNKPYYNYYMYLPNHSKTTYSSTNINDYIRNVMGKNKNVFGDVAVDNASKLYGEGTFLYYAQQKFGVNAILSLSLSRNETGNGTSNIAINKNNGFGLNAVDSSPGESANWYPSFSSSILGYASKWITYGYSKPGDSRYRGGSFGNKGIGMSVKYASDPFWSDKMASNYYALDSYYGLQDYDYYQLGVTNTTGIPAKGSPNNNGKHAFYINYQDAPVIIVDEVTGDSVNGNNKWYKVVSDLNVDQYANELYAYTDYNWQSGYVYVPAAFITKINQGKNGNIGPNSVTEFKDSKYSYDLYNSGNTFNPRVATTNYDAPYYYDSTLSAKTNKTVLKDKYVMVYTAAYNEYGKAVAYLVTSDYKYDQKHWVKADALTFKTTNYGKETVDLKGQYAWVNYNTVDSANTVISGQYTNSYFPVLDTLTINGVLWHKIPVDLDRNNNSYGYILANDSAARVTVYKSNGIPNDSVAEDNTKPVINVEDKEVLRGTAFDAKDKVTAIDKEDGDITKNIIITSNNVNTAVSGTYSITYQVTDSKGSTTTKTIKVIVVENTEPVFNVTNKEITINTIFDPLKDVVVTDKEDGDLTSSLRVITNSVDISTLGIYKVVYEVTTKQNEKFTKEITVTVVKDEAPVINATNKQITLNSTFNEKAGVTATDKEDKDLTSKIEVIENTVDTSIIGTYSITYQVTDSASNTTTLKIIVEVIEKELTKKDGEFYLHELKFNTLTKKYDISGYTIILNTNNKKDTNINYELVFRSKRDEDLLYTIKVDRMLNNHPFPLGEENGYDYTYAWWNDSIDLSVLPVDDYDIYMKVTTDDDYTYQAVNNLFNMDITRRASDTKKAYSFKVNLGLKAKTIELAVRKDLITESTSNTYHNMVNDYDSITFTNNLLKVVGTSYNYNGTYNKDSLISRKLYLENTESFKRVEFDLGFRNDVGYKFQTTDNKSKEYTWYSKEIDVSNLEKGTYSLQVYTKVKDSEDYGEITDRFAAIEEAKTTINGKTYEVVLNKERFNRIELVVS